MIELGKKTERFNLRLSKETAEALKAAAALKKTNMTAFINDLIEKEVAPILELNKRKD